MGAEYQSVTFLNATKEEVQKMWAKDVEQSLYDYGHCYSGAIGMLGADIEWVFESFPTERECDDWIMEHHEKWEPPLGVAFNGGWVVGGWCAS